jgi:anti-sigma regulatory factor (Ser/Thr protein kinase)
VITRQQIRAVLADGARLVDGAGHPVGRIVDVVLDVRTVEPAYLTVACGLPGGVAAVVPVTRARLLDGSVQVPYTVADVRGAPLVDPPGGHLDRGQEAELRRYYAVLDDGAAVAARRRAGGAAAPQPAPSWPPTPPGAGNGHRRANGTAAGSDGVRAGVDVLPAVAGLDVRLSDDRPAAYPATSSGPWLPVSTSSAGPPWWHRRQWRWPSVPTSVRAMRLELRPFLDLTGLPADELEDLVLAAGEAAANAVEHARLPAPPYFDVLAEVGERWAHVVVQDHGLWRPASADGDRGRGLQMIGVLTDATLTVGQRGTTVALRSRRNAGRPWSAD